MTIDNRPLRLVGNGLVDTQGVPLTPEGRAQLFMAEYQYLCKKHHCQLMPVFIMRGGVFESRLEVEISTDEHKNTN